MMTQQSKMPLKPQMENIELEVGASALPQALLKAVLSKLGIEALKTHSVSIRLVHPQETLNWSADEQNFMGFRVAKGTNSILLRSEVSNFVGRGWSSMAIPANICDSWSEIQKASNSADFSPARWTSKFEQIVASLSAEISRHI